MKIRQWGSCQPHNQNDVRVNYPIAFSINVFRIFGIDCKYFIESSGTSGRYSYQYAGQSSKDFSLSGFTIQGRDGWTSGKTTFTYHSEIPLNYLVIGH